MLRIQRRARQGGPIGDQPVAKKLNKLLDLYEAGRGAELSRGTLWGAYNAMAELVDHSTNYRSIDGKTANVLVSGSGQLLKTRAYANAVALLR